MKQQPHWLKLEILMHVSTHQMIHDLAREQQLSIPELIKLAVEAYQPPPLEMGPAEKPSYSPYIVPPETMKFRCLDDMALCASLHQPEPVAAPVPVPKKRAA